MRISRIEIAARTTIERMPDDDHNGIARYRFDTRGLVGDYEIIEVPLPFASEEAARTIFYNNLVMVAE